MAQTSWPFENIDTTETQFSQWARNINEGIKQGTGSELAVSAPGGGMTVQVASGQAMIRGHYYSNTATETLTIAAANPSNPRIDSVVLELDPSVNTVILKVLAGTPAGSPVAPSLTQTDSGIYQLRLANVAVGAGVLQIVSGNLTDLRTYMFAGVGRWTTATRPANPVQNQTVGFNTTINQHEYWNGSAWVPFTPADSVRDTDYSTTGDILYASAPNTPTRLPIGANNTVLKSNGTTLEWGANPTPLSAFTISGTKTLPNDAGHYAIGRRFSVAGNMWLNGAESFSGTETTGPTGLFDSNQFANLSANAVVEFYPAWTTSASFGTTHTANSMAFLNGTYYVATDYLAGANARPTISLSTNRTTWTTPTTPYLASNNTATCQAFGNAVYVVAGGGGQIMSSTNGTTWTARTSGTASTIRGIRFANNQFVASAGTSVVQSTDGVTWTLHATTGVQSEHAPAYGTQGWFVAQTPNLYATSPDGTTWTTRTNSISTSSIYAATFGNGVYLMGGSNGALIRSTNITTWAAQTSGFGTSAIFGLASGAGVHVAVGDGGTIRSSTDGITWTARTSGIGGRIDNVSFANNLFFAYSRGVDALLTSTNGTTWTGSASNTTVALQDQFGQPAIVWDGTRYFSTSQATGISAEPAVKFSTNASIWSGVGHWFRDRDQRNIAAVNNVLIAGGNNNRAQASTDGLIWTPTPAALVSGSNQTFYASMWAAHTGFVIGGGNGSNEAALLTSTDALTWTSRTSGFGTGVITGLASNGTIAIAVGQDSSGSNSVLTNSTNGIVWGPVTSPSGTNLLMGAAFGNGVFMIVASSNRIIFTSTDSITWTNRGSAGIYGPVSTDCLHFLNNQFIVHGSNGNNTAGIAIALSTDGITWRGRAVNRNTSSGVLGADVRAMVHDGTQFFGWYRQDSNNTGFVTESNVGNMTLYLTNYGTPTVL